MNAGSTAPDPGRPPASAQVGGGHFAAHLATLIALAATGLALIDLFANGLSQTLIHVVLGLAVFTAVRLSIGIALDPYRPAAYDAPETHP